MSTSFLPPIRGAASSSSPNKQNQIVVVQQHHQAAPPQQSPTSSIRHHHFQNHSLSPSPSSTSRRRTTKNYYQTQDHINIVSPPTNHIIADAILDKINDRITEERLIKNTSQRGSVEHAERTGREEIITQYYEYFDLLKGHLGYIEDKNQKKKPIHARAAPGFCLSRLEQRIADQAKKDREQEAWCRAEGRRQVEADKEKAKVDAKKREEMKRRLREDMVGFRAAGVFLIAEESRQRATLDNEMGNTLYGLKKRFTEEEAFVMKAVADREAKEEAARKEVVAAAKKEAAALEDKRQAEVKRRQDKLIGKCTHARNGGSVFTGPYPKKMCLICRIKLDTLSGLYVQMEGKHGK